MPNLPTLLDDVEAFNAEFADQPMWNAAQVLLKRVATELRAELASDHDGPGDDVTIKLTLPDDLARWVDSHADEQGWSRDQTVVRLLLAHVSCA